MKSNELNEFYRMKFRLASKNIYDGIVSNIRKDEYKVGFIFIMHLSLNENTKLLFSNKALPNLGSAKEIISLRKINEKEKQMLIENEI